MHFTETLAILIPEEAARALKDYEQPEFLIVSNLPDDIEEDTLKSFLIFKFTENKTNMFIENIKVEGNLAQVQLKSKQGMLLTAHYLLKV